MKNISELIRNRKSIRTFEAQELRWEDCERLLPFLAKLENPYGIPVEFKFLDVKEHNLTSPVISGASLYIGAKIKKVPHAEEAFGHTFEQLVLYAQSLGIGTVWLGGTMDRKAFEHAMELRDDELMCCVSPLGYPAKKPSLRESMMRTAVKADARLPFEALFFDGSFDVPLTKEAAGALAEPLELIRWAPSAVNRQPWRVVVSGNTIHFYLKRSKGFVRGAAGDLQKIDLGIALCHFELATKSSGLDPTFMIQDPGIQTDAEYIASYQVLR